MRGSDKINKSDMDYDVKFKTIQGKIVVNTIVRGNLMVEIKDCDRPGRTKPNLFRIINRPQMVIMPDNIVEGYLVKTTYETSVYNNVRYAFYVTDNLTLRLRDKDFYDIIDITVINLVKNNKEFLGKQTNDLNVYSLYAKGRETANAMLRYLCISMILEYTRTPNEAEVCARYNKKRMFNHAVSTVEQACETYPKFKELRDNVKKELDRIYSNIMEYEIQEEVFEFIPQ
jgi:hypothetical protein